MSDQVLILRDGRRLGFAEYGDPAGFAVLNCHGGLACRLDVAWADGVARRGAIRLISPDRPGVGLSDTQPGRTVLDWAADVSELTKHLGVERFSVTGWSMGGPYAAAVGYALGDAVHRLAIVAGALPLDEPGRFEQLPLVDRVYTRLSQRQPGTARGCFRAMSAVAGVAPGLYGRVVAHGLGAADETVIRDEGFDAFARMSREALRQPGGVVEEYRGWMRPWGFALEELRVTTDVWVGAEDSLLDPRWARELARRIPRATLQVRPGGHFMAHLHCREIFDALGGT
ncbi:MAG: alpha/beta fold hydrolase [Candidatus Sericytochromatia bacterium]